MSDKSKKEKADSINSILIKALLNIKNLIDQLGDLLSPDVLKWLSEWNGKEFEKVSETKIDVIGEKIIIKNGKARGNGKTRSLKTAVKLDNLLIVVHGGGKGKGEGMTFFPKKENDRVVIFLDEADVNDELQMKLVLFHELVHVKQIRDKNSGFKKIRDSLKGREKTDKEIINEIKNKLKDNFEAEAHLATLFLAALLIQAHPEGEDSILNKYKTALENLIKYREKSKDKLKLFNQLIKTLGKLIPDIKSENDKLNEQIDSLKKLRDKFKTELERYLKSLPQIKESKKIKHRLNTLKKEADKTVKNIDDFEKLKLKITKKESVLREKLKDIARKAGELEKIKQEIAKQNDRSEKAGLKEEYLKLNKALKKLKKSVKKDVDKLDQLLLKEQRKVKAVQSGIKKVIGELVKELSRCEDYGLIDVLTQLMGAFRKSSTVLKKLEFKLDLLKEIEKELKKIL